MVKPEKWRYGVVLDAGSSGTRIYIYRWLRNSLARLEPSNLHRLPELETKDKWTEKIHPGISTFGETPQLVGPEHLDQLLQHALKYVPAELVSSTPIFLLATAGVRLLPPNQQKALLSNVCSYIQTHSDFWIPDCNLHIQVIPGQTEGLYGWVAANYLLGGFDAPEEHSHGQNHHTYGFLDMGGASAQIAFAPNATEAAKHANDLTLLRLRTVAGETQEYRVFVTTWLGFGVNEARRRYLKQLLDSYTANTLEIPDPCLPAHLTMTLDGQIIAPTESTKLSTERHLLGTGNFNECLRRTLPLLEKDRPCPDPPCLINGVHVPAIDFDVNHFIGISEYWHTTHEIFEYGHDDKAFDFNTYQTRVKQFCEQEWSTIQGDVTAKAYGKKVDEQTAYEVCFKASWLISMLHDGIGIPRVGLENTSSPVGLNGTKEVIESAKEKGYIDAFQAVKDIKSTEVSWTLGKMVLYAAADVPVADYALPVGFGSNLLDGGIPADFQYPGGGALQGIDPSGASGGDFDDDDATFSDSLFRADAPHRLPGFVLFLVIMIIIVFYLCGRDRRSRILGAMFRSGSRPDTNHKPSVLSNRHSSNHVSSLIDRILGRRSLRSNGQAYTAVSGHDRDLEGGRLSRDDSRSYIPRPEDFELTPMSGLDSHKRLSGSDDNNDEDDVFSETSSTYAALKSGRSHGYNNTKSDKFKTRSRSRANNGPSGHDDGGSKKRHSSPMFNFRNSPPGTYPQTSRNGSDNSNSSFDHSSRHLDTDRPGSSGTGTGVGIGVGTSRPNSVGMVGGGRMTPDIIDRKGLVVRTESRDSLAIASAAGSSGYTGKLAAGQRSKSRAGSPDRFNRE